MQRYIFGFVRFHITKMLTLSTENRCLTICLDYRLAPENPYPAAVIDTVDTVKWIYQHGKSELNANVNKIAVGGSSRYRHVFPSPADHELLMTMAVVETWQRLYPSRHRN